MLDSEKPPTSSPTVNEPLPTEAEETQPASTSPLPPTTNLYTLCALLAKPLDNYFQSSSQRIPLLKQKFQSSTGTPVETAIPVFPPEAPPVEPEIPSNPIMKTLLTAATRKCLHVDFKCPHRPLCYREEIYQEDTLLILHIQLPSLYQEEYVTTVPLQAQCKA